MDAPRLSASSDMKPSTVSFSKSQTCRPIAIGAKRLSVARQEVAQWKHFDYLIVSQSVAEDLRRTQAIVDAEKMRQSRARLPQYEEQ